MIIVSKYDSRCNGCRGQVAVGQQCDWQKGIKGVMCLTCAGTAAPVVTRADTLALTALAACEACVVDAATRNGLNQELEAEWSRYQKLKSLALHPGTPAEGKVALKMALVQMVKIVF